MSDSHQVAMVNDLLRVSGETSCVEFKENFASPSMIGKFASAIANSAALSDQSCGYVVWGIHNGTHSVVGTQFQPDRTRVEQQPLEPWLAQRLTPNVSVSFKAVEHPDGRVVVLKIPAANTRPVEFDSVAYVRFDSTTHCLVDHPDQERRLWARMQSEAWEFKVAGQLLTGDEVLDCLDYPKYFELTRQRLPDNRVGIFERLKQDRLIVGGADEYWSVTNLGAILFAKRLGDFDFRLGRKAIRFARHAGQGRTDPVTHSRDWERGYATAFSEVVEYVNGLVPTNETIGAAFRTEHRPFSEIAVREVIANALIHQDMTATGAGPLIELFADRIEITNPGTPVVDTERFIEAAPRPRNVALAAFMQRMRLCEGIGIGIDRVVSDAEARQSPPPRIQVYSGPGPTRVMLFAPCRFRDMMFDEKVRACYQHAVLRYLAKRNMHNGSLRERFGLDTKGSGPVSKLIGAAEERGWIKPADPNHPQSGYVPFWA